MMEVLLLCVMCVMFFGFNFLDLFLVYSYVVLYVSVFLGFFLLFLLYLLYITFVMFSQWLHSVRNKV